MKFIVNFTTTNNKYLSNHLSEKINKKYYSFSKAYVTHININVLYIGDTISWKIMQIFKIPIF